MRNLLLTVLLCFVSLTSFSQCDIKEKVDEMYGHTTYSTKWLALKDNFIDSYHIKISTISKDYYTLHFTYQESGIHARVVSTNDPLVIKNREGIITTIYPAELVTGYRFNIGKSWFTKTNVRYVISKEQFLALKDIELLQFETTDKYFQTKIKTKKTLKFNSLIECISGITKSNEIKKINTIEEDSLVINSYNGLDILYPKDTIREVRFGGYLGYHYAGGYFENEKAFGDGWQLGFVTRFRDNKKLNIDLELMASRSWFIPAKSTNQYRQAYTQEKVNLTLLVNYKILNLKNNIGFTSIKGGLSSGTNLDHFGVDESNYDLYYHFYVVGVEQTITLNKTLLFVDFRVMPLMIEPTFPFSGKTMLLENIQINLGLKF